MARVYEIFDAAHRIPNDIELGIGTWAWGDRVVWGFGSDYADDDVYQAFTATLDAGIRMFDTAEMYGVGESERLLGGFMQATGRKPYIATKFAPVPWRLSGETLFAALRGSLQRLNMLQVDLYQIHWTSPFVPVETWADALAGAVKRELVRAVGVSNYNPQQTRSAYNTLARYGIPLASNQVEYSLIERSIERDGTMKLCNELGIRVIAYSPLGMGLLTGKYTPDNPPPGMRGMRYRRLLTRVQPLLSLLREIASGRGKTPAQVALNWTICKGTLPIPGAKNARQAEHNAGAVGWRLTDDEVAALDMESSLVGR